MRIKDGIIMPKADIIPTPSFFLNHLFKGGFKTGLIHTLWGREGSGKTTMALSMAKTAQEMGYLPVIIDTEKALDQERIEVDFGIEQPYEWIQKNILEDVNKELLPLMRETGQRLFIVVDSINFLIKENFFKNDDSQGGMAMPARSQTEFCLKIMNEMSTSHITMLLAHTTVDLSQSKPAVVGKFPKMVEHTSSNIIKFLPSMSTSGNNPETIRSKQDGTILSQRVYWEIKKSKQGPLKGTKGWFNFNPSTGKIDSDQEIVKLAARTGIIDASSQGWLKIDGKSLRESQVMQMLKDDDTFRNNILEKIVNMPGTYLKMLDSSEEIDIDE